MLKEPEEIIYVEVGEVEDEEIEVDVRCAPFGCAMKVGDGYIRLL